MGLLVLPMPRWLPSATHETSLWVQSRAARPETGEPVVVKCHQKARNGKDEIMMTQRCQDEIATLKCLSDAPHPHVLHQHVIMDESDRVVIVFPFGQGGDLLQASAWLHPVRCSPLRMLASLLRPVVLCWLSQ